MKHRAPTILLATSLLLLASCHAPQPFDAMWSVRMDSTEDVNKPSRFTLLPGGGIEAKGGGNATLWRPGEPLTPPYRLSMHVKTTNLGLHPHGAGLTFGGNDVAGDQQTYSYFLVRGDGNFLIKTRDGGGTADICLWTEHDAITKEDQENGIANNVLAVDVGKDMTRFSINGTKVHEAKTAELHASGKYGARLVHDLVAHFDQIEVTTQQ